MFSLKFFKFQKNKEQKNNGFTLIEVLVSMLILAIIIAPILGNISQASRVNQMSRRMQDASTLGQNMMESLKTRSSFEDVAKQLIYKNDGTFDLFSLDNLSNVSTGQVEYDASSKTFKAVADPCITKEQNLDGSYIYSLKENANRKYQFQVSNIKYNGREYCAKIEYDASAYSKDDPAEDDQYNDKDMPILPSVSDDTNAVVALTYQDDWAASTLKVKYDAYYNSTYDGDNDVDNTKIAQNMKRRLTLNLTHNNSTNKYMVTGAFRYTLINLIPDGVDASLRTYEDEFYHKEFDSIENVYLFFTPNLELKTDEIQIINKLTGPAADLNVYLVEQSNPKITEATYRSAMGAYLLSVDLQEDEPPLSPASNQYIYHTKIRTNLGSTIEGFPGTSKIQYAGKNADQVNQDVLIDREIAKTRIYNISIDLYNQPEDATAMFKKDDYIISFTSSKGE